MSARCKYWLAVPEPETYAMMLAGLGLVGFLSRASSRSLSLSHKPCQAGRIEITGGCDA